MIPTKTSWKEILSWCMYDFANSAFSTIVLTVVYSVYFKETLCGGGSIGDFLWGLSISLAYFFVAVSSPFLGAWSDQRGSRKKFLIAATLLSITATAALSLLKPGMIAIGMTLFILGFYGFAVGNVFYNTLLLDISEPETVGRISGLGWGIGYLGGLGSLALCYPWISKNQIPFTFILTSLFFLVFSIPTFMFVKSRQPKTNRSLGLTFNNSLHQLNETRRSIFQHKDLLLFFLAYFFFNDGLSTIITFCSIYAHDTFHMSMKEITLLFILLQVTSFAGAIISGPWVDRWGPKKIILGTLGLWIITTLWAFSALSKTQFWIVSLFAGLGLGSCQSASRSYVALSTPAHKSGEFFGFFAVFTKFSSILGPFLFGLISHVLNSQRNAILSILVFFVIGLILMIKVRDLRIEKEN